MGNEKIKRARGIADFSKKNYCGSNTLVRAL